MSDYILEIKHVTKEFPGVKALSDVCLNVERGEIHGLVGENGAGKSTLMKILSGVYPKGTYEGEVCINGKPAIFKTVKDAEKASIGIIYQELMLVPELSIAENIFLGRLYKYVNWDKVNSEAKKYIDILGLNESPVTPVKDIGVGKQQLVEIAKALAKNVKFLILDEPTASLTETEIKHLLQILRELRNEGVTCIYISHKLNEVLDICDRITVLRDGMTIGTYPAAEMTENAIISRMVGRDFSDRFPPRPDAQPGDVVFEVRNMTITKFGDPDKKIIDDVSFSLRSGEVLGISGLMGAGRTELVNTIFGDFRGTVQHGEILVGGAPVKITAPLDAIKAGISLATEDRKHNGLNLIADIETNILMPSLKRFVKGGVIQDKYAALQCEELSQKLRIKAPSIKTVVNNLSGGNQQKTVLAKWLLPKPKVLIIDEPTRGIDVGAKYEIYNLMNQLKAEGMAIIMVSSELPEILGMSDRILVLSEGRVTAELENHAGLTEEQLMEKAIGTKS